VARSSNYAQLLEALRFVMEGRMRNVAAVCFCFLIFLPLFAGLPALAQQGGSEGPDPAVYEDRAAWLRDLDALYDRLQEIHPDYTHHTSAEDWQLAYDALRADVPSLNWSGYVTRTAQFVALMYDGHTTLFPFAFHGTGFEEQYPLRAYFFDGEVYVTRTSEDAAQIVGGRIIQVGDVPAQDAFARLMTVISAGSPMWKVNWSPIYLRQPGIVEGLGLANSDGSMTLMVETPHGETVSATINPAPTNPEPSLTTLFDAYNPQADYPRWMTEEAPYIFEYLENENAVYLIYGAVESLEDDPIDQFAERLFQFIEENDIERLIIDVRNNGGGDNTLNAPFVHGVIASKLNRPGGIYVLVGRQTFSAAQNFANWMERHTQALFVGEPTGGRPNHFGDAEFFVLPETHLGAIISTLRWQDSFDSDPRLWIRPDLPADLTFDDFLAGRDPALEAALTHNANDIAMQPFTALRWHRDTQYLGWDVPIAGMRGVYDEEGNEVR